MKRLWIVAVLLVAGISALLLVYNFAMAPVADATTRAKYAASLQQSFAESNVRDVTISAFGARNEFLRLNADWLDQPTAIALISDNIGRRAREYGFQRVVFENQGASFAYDVGKQMFEPK
jgi:hypothetical protein